MTQRGRFCGNCGSASTRGAQHFCTECGARLTDTANVPPVADAVPTTAAKTRPPRLMWLGVALAALGAVAVTATTLMLPGRGSVGLDQLAISGSVSCVDDWRTQEVAWTLTGWTFAESGRDTPPLVGSLTRGSDLGGWLQVTGSELGEVRVEGLAALKVSPATPIQITYEGPDGKMGTGSMVLESEVSARTDGVLAAATLSDEGVCTLSAQGKSGQSESDVRTAAMSP